MHHTLADLCWSLSLYSLFRTLLCLHLSLNYCNLNFINEETVTLHYISSLFWLWRDPVPRIGKISSLTELTYFRVHQTFRLSWYDTAACQMQRLLSFFPYHNDLLKLVYKIEGKSIVMTHKHRTSVWVCVCARLRARQNDTEHACVCESVCTIIYLCTKSFTCVDVYVC